MRIPYSALSPVVICFLLAASATAQVPQLINYQGRLLNGTNLVNGPQGLSLRLFNVPSGGGLIYEDSNSVTVVDGLYATFLGDNTTSGSLSLALTNAQLWLEAMVNGTALTPRERIASVAYALNAWQLNGNTGTVSGTYFLGTKDNQPFELRTFNQRVARFDTATNAAGALIPNVILGHSANLASNNTAFGSVIGGGGNMGNPQIVGAAYDTVAGGVGNKAIGGDSTIAGGRRSIASGLQSYVGGGFQNFAMGQNSAIGGGSNNNVAAHYATIGGGVNNSIAFNSSRGTIGGGQDNLLDTGAEYTTIAGGQNNSASVNASHAAIGGGEKNSVAINAKFGTIAGGQSNFVSPAAISSSIGGGFYNIVDGYGATVPGGSENYAGNSFTFAAGNRAKAPFLGSFVWSDSRPFDFSSSSVDEFNVRAVGGTRIVSGIDGTGTVTSGVQLAAGSGSWTSLSDVNAKTDFRPVDSAQILERVEKLSLQTWRYKTQNAAVRHIGPTAQDFNQAFGVGDFHTGITGVDADGVALAAIQELIRQNRTLQDRVAELEKRLADVQ